MKIVYKLLLTGNSIMLFFLIYLIKEHMKTSSLRDILSVLVYVVIILLFTLLCLFFSRFLPSEIISGGIQDVELVDGTYLPSYLGYFFVALSIENISTVIIVGAIIAVFVYYSQTLYFNPLFLIFKYKFYYLTMDNGMKLFILTTRSIRNVDGLKFVELKRINDFTFIDRGKYE